MAPSCRLVTSWPLDSGIGSGVAAVAVGLQRALEEKGWGTEHLFPQYSSGGYLSTSLKRILFNLRLGTDSRLTGKLPVISFDFDGFALNSSIGFASINGGLLGDIVRFESGLIRQAVRFMAMLEKTAARKAGRIFVPSEYSKKTICTLYSVPEAKVEVMYNGIFYDEWTESVGRAKQVPGRPPTVLSVARLYKRKGLDRLIALWPGVLASNPGAKLVIVGGGLEFDNLVSMTKRLGVEESVSFEGDVRSPERMAAFYANCDLFCLPSLHETFGLVFIEAMAAKKPVVALKTTAVPEVVRDGTDGFLVEPENTSDLVIRINSLLKNVELRERMGAEGSARVKNRYDWPKVVKPLIEWMEQSNVQK